MDELVREALTEYKEEYEKWTKLMLPENKQLKDIRLLTDNMLIYQAIKDATESLRELNEKNQKGWNKENDGRQEYSK